MTITNFFHRYSTHTEAMVPLVTSLTPFPAYLVNVIPWGSTAYISQFFSHRKSSESSLPSLTTNACFLGLVETSLGLFTPEVDGTARFAVCTAVTGETFGPPFLVLSVLIGMRWSSRKDITDSLRDEESKLGSSLLGSFWSALLLSWEYMPQVLKPDLRLALGIQSHSFLGSFGMTILVILPFGSCLLYPAIYTFCQTFFARTNTQTPSGLSIWEELGTRLTKAMSCSWQASRTGEMKGMQDYPLWWPSWLHHPSHALGTDQRTTP